MKRLLVRKKKLKWSLLISGSVLLKHPKVHDYYILCGNRMRVWLMLNGLPEKELCKRAKISQKELRNILNSFQENDLIEPSY